MSGCLEVVVGRVSVSLEASGRCGEGEREGEGVEVEPMILERFLCGGAGGISGFLFLFGGS